MDEDELDRRLRHALLSCASHPLSEDAQGQCAELCLSAGRVGLARAFHEIVFLRRGFSATELRRQAEVAARTGLWTRDGALDEAPVRRLSNTVALAVDELERLAQRLTSTSPERGADDRVTSPVTGDPPVASGLDLDRVHALYGMMRRPWAEEGQPGAKWTLQGLLRTIGREPAVDLALICTAPVADLAMAAVQDGLRRWVADCRDLVDEPFGSAVLLHASARFDAAGLGAYFNNVDQIIRRSADLLDLARRATVAAELGPGMNIWVTLLSRKVNGSTLLDLVDELGDRGALSTMTMIWRWTAAKPASDIPIDRLWRLRDTAIDLAAFDLAAEIQGAIVRLRPHHPHEFSILGTIQATGGHRVKAEAAFKQCLAANPNDADARLRLRALEAGRFAAFELREGFGTSALQRHARRRRLIAASAAADSALPKTSIPDVSPN